MSYEITGKILVKYDTQKVSDKFQKREFVLNVEDHNNGQVYTSTPKFQLTQDRCNLLDSINQGDNVKVSFNVKGNKWEKDGVVSYFSNLDAWKVELEVINAYNNVTDKVEEITKNEAEDELPF
tara:strand:- start:87 stop:455 length:369 start_codon:yes stop_codon:yes gene_type:complete